MVRILGNSPERVQIRDLGDVIYYKQQKDYTDQEFEMSKDLQKELKKGTLTLLGKFENIRGSSEDGGNGKVVLHQEAPAVSLEDIKQAVREVLPQEQGMSLKGLIPTLVDSLKKELSSFVGVGGSSGSFPTQRKEFEGPEYVPTVDTSGMISNVEVEKRETSGDSVSSNLEALRKLQKGKQ